MEQSAESYYQLGFGLDVINLTFCFYLQLLNKTGQRLWAEVFQMSHLQQYLSVVRNMTADILMKQDCIDKVCNLPLTFKQVDKSFNALLTETKFQFFYKEISIADIIQYLQIHL